MEISSTFWVILLSFGAFVLAIALYIGMTHNSHRSSKESVAYKAARDRYRKNERNDP